MRLKCFHGRGQGKLDDSQLTGNAGDGEAGSWHDPSLGNADGAVRARAVKLRCADELSEFDGGRNGAVDSTPSSGIWKRE